MKHRLLSTPFLLGLLLVLIFFVLPPVGVWAGGGGSYPNGAEGFMVGAVPPPGFYVVNYTYYYHASDLNDNHGDNIDVFDDINVWADVLRFIWISNHKLLGGDYGQHLFIPLLDIDLDFKDPVGPKHKKHYSDTDVPYLIYSPFILAHHWLSGQLHTVVSLCDIYIPTGQDDDNLAGVGHNFWTFEPVFAITYMPSPSWEFSAKFMYDFNTEQDDCPTVYGVNVDRDPGQEFHFDYNVSYGLTKSFRIGVGGYYYKQTTDDDYHLNGSIPLPVRNFLEADENHHSEVFAVGPGLWYNYKNMFMTLRTQFEMEAENKTEGQNVWFKFTYAF